MKHIQIKRGNDIGKNLSGFSKYDSQALKGIAILLMLFHHCYRTIDKFGDFAVNTYPLSQSQLIVLGQYAKVCVSLFAFISGFGLYESYKRKKSDLNDNKWVKNHLFSTLSGFWLIAVIAYLVVFVVKYNMQQNLIYGYGDNWIERIFKIGADVLGISSILGTKSLNGTWWYMGAAVLFVVVTPLLAKALEKSWAISALVIIAVIPRVFDIGFLGGSSAYTFLEVFLVGMILNKYQFFEWIAQKNEKHKVIMMIGLTSALLFGVYSYRLIEKDIFWEYQYIIVPLTVIVFCKFVLFRLSLIKEILMFFGKHSLNIWLVHTFFRDLMPGVVWGNGRWFGIPPVIMFIMSLVFSIVIEYIKKIIHYPGCLKKQK